MAITHDPSVLPAFSSVWQSHGNHWSCWKHWKSEFWKGWSSAVQLRPPATIIPKNLEEHLAVGYWQITHGDHPHLLGWAVSSIQTHGSQAQLPRSYCWTFCLPSRQHGPIKRSRRWSTSSTRRRPPRRRLV